MNLFQLDPTYKLMREGFPTFVYGTSNVVHEFFPAGICIASNEDSETFAAVFANMDGNNIKEVMGDGDKGLSKAQKEVWPSDTLYTIEREVFGETVDDEETDGEVFTKEIEKNRLMCFIHVDRNCQKKVPQRYKAEIMEDIRKMRNCENREEFDTIHRAFQQKWRKENNDDLNKFLSYFYKVWIFSQESNWFTGAGCLDHNNGLEAKNLDIKRTKVLRPKQPLGDFFKNAEDIVYGMSIKEDERLFCHQNELISKPEITTGWQWLQSNQKKSDIVEIRGKFYVKSSKAAFQEDLSMKAKELIRAKRINFAEKTFDDWNKIKGEVFELEKKSEIVTCTCPLGMQHRFCKHKVGLMIKHKIITIPESVMVLPIGAKNKRGRPRKIGGALSFV